MDNLEVKVLMDLFNSKILDHNQNDIVEAAQEKIDSLLQTGATGSDLLNALKLSIVIGNYRYDSDDSICVLVDADKLSLFLGYNQLLVREDKREIVFRRNLLNYSALIDSSILIGAFIKFVLHKVKCYCIHNVYSYSTFTDIQQELNELHMELCEDCYITKDKFVVPSDLFTNSDILFALSEYCAGDYCIEVPVTELITYVSASSDSVKSLLKYFESTFLSAQRLDIRRAQIVNVLGLIKEENVFENCDYFYVRVGVWKGITSLFRLVLGDNCMYNNPCNNILEIKIPKSLLK